jgi:hypothetical protein
MEEMLMPGSFHPWDVLRFFDHTWVMEVSEVQDCSF